jgi:hypothetical protein
MTSWPRGPAMFPDLADVFCAAPGEFLPGDGGEGQAAGRAQKRSEPPEYSRSVRT